MNNSTDYPTHATLQIRSSEAVGAPKEIQCKVERLTGKRLSLISPERVALSSAASVEYNDSVLLCEVMACTQDFEQRWHLEMQVEQILTGLQSLVLLRERLMGASTHSRRKTAVTEAARA